MTRQGEDDPPETPAPEGRARDGYGRGVSPFRPAGRRPLLHRLAPVSERLGDYGGGMLRRDLLAGVTVAALARGEHIRADTELGAMGAANLAAGISQGFPIGGAGSRTAVNDQMGARTSSRARSPPRSSPWCWCS
jgi:Sulfate permease family